LKAIKLALLGSAFAFAATTANAADIYNNGSFKDASQFEYAPITWTGFYIGGHVGVSLTDELSFSHTEDGSKFFEGVGVDNAFVAGVQIGYNRQTASNWVYGVEADLSFLNDNLDKNVDLTDFLASVRGRLGIASGNSLLYVTGGVAFLGYSDKFTKIFEDEGTKIDKTSVGFVVGAGIEHKLRNNFSVGLEGLYYNFSSNVKDTVACDPCEFQSTDLDRDFWVVRARASYHFGSDPGSPLK
jgi:outer membrane immunogenic protein